MSDAATSDEQRETSPAIAEARGLGDWTDKTKDTRLIELAVRKGWDIPDAVLKALPAKMLEIVLKSPRERNRIAAAKILVAMHGQNQGVRVEHEHEHRHAHLHAIAAEDLRREILKDPEYLEWLQTRQLEREHQQDGDAGPVCDARKPGQVEAGAAPAASQQGDH